MIDEGPVLTVYLYEDCNWEKTICFTGYIFCDDRDIISYLTKKFKDYAGFITNKKIKVDYFIAFIYILNKMRKVRTH